MKNTSRFVFAALLAAVVVNAPAERARACGGLVQPTTGTVSQAGQVAIISTHGGVTDLVLTLDVPDAANAFGVLVPVPVEPTIDGTPVSTDAIASLEQLTRPVVGFPDSGGGGGGCSCGDALGGADNTRGIIVGEAVDVGPVTAQWLSGAQGSAITDWLTTEGFALPADAQPVIDAYVNEGLSFVAFKRNDTATGAARVGVHLTMDGDHLAYAMVMSGVGASSSMTYTLFVGAPTGRGPDTPWTPLRIADLDATVAQADYPAAVAAAVSDAGGKAFVVETVTDPASLGIPELDAFFPAGTQITRLSTVVDAANLDADVTFTSPAPENLTELPAAGLVSSGRGLPPPRTDLALAALFVTLAATTVVKRRRLAT